MARPVEVGTAFAICHRPFPSAIRRHHRHRHSPFAIAFAFPGRANEPHNFCRLHFAAKAPDTDTNVLDPAPAASPNPSDTPTLGSCFNEV